MSRVFRQIDPYHLDTQRCGIKNYRRIFRHWLAFVKTTKPHFTIKSQGLFFAALLAALLAVLFWKSFLPGYVHFSNDGPLGEQNVSWLQPPRAFTGMWDDLNDIGFAAGAMAPDVTALFRMMLGPVGISKFIAPLALFILGLGAWSFLRQLKLSPLAAALGALAATLNSAYFATACWGVAPQQIAIGMDFFALALVVSNTAETSTVIRWTRLALAGLAIGVSVMEGADVGAIFSLLVAAFVFFMAVAGENGPTWAGAGRGIIRMAVIALFAGFIAFQTVVSLVGTQIQGVAGTGQDTESKAQHWDWATQWSLPKIETLGLFVPGVFGYKYDTPKDMMDFLQNSYRGGVYWGAVGRDPAWDRYFAGGEKGPAPQGLLRFAGGQNYAGILVVLVALWAIAQSLRRQNSVFAGTQRRFIWFWAVVLLVSLLLAWGRFAPFDYYKHTIYALPYFSTIRNPAKFILVFSFAVVILFAYGMNALNRRYLETPATGATSLPAQLKNWRTKAGRFDRNWTWFCLLAFVISVPAWLVYAEEKPALARYLQEVGYPDAETANQMAAFSVGQVGWFILLFALTIGLCLLVLAGVFAGKRAGLGGILLGALLVGDLGRADLPYITHWDYKQKYDIDPANRANSTNPIINFLRDKPYEHRVAALPPFNVPQHLPFYNDYFGDVYRIEWAQHHFPYYNIQSLDKIQMPRMPADLLAYEMALTPRSTDTTYLWARRWELTNTRYLLGAVGFLDVLNEQLDPAQHRFRIFQRFDIVPKPGVEQVTQLAEMTAAPSDNGALAIFEFTGALPRAGLYSHWQAGVNDPATLQRWLDELRRYLPADAYSALTNLNTTDQATLETLTDANFDPAKTVLLSAPLPVVPVTNSINDNAGTVEFKRYVPTDAAFKGKKNDLWKQSGYCYAPDDIMFSAQAAMPSVLLLNDMFDPNWRVLVDGKSAPLLRCNFIMRGVFLTPGAHTVEFQFSLPNKPLYITLSAIGAGILLCGFLFIARRSTHR